MAFLCRTPLPRTGQNRSQQNSRRLDRFVLPSLLALSLGLAGALSLLAPETASSQQPGAPGQPPPPPAKASPIEEAIRLMNEGAKTYQSVKDYTCTLYKQERVKGQLQPENTIALKFRTQPFSVYMKWLAPQAMAGQEVAYVHGKNKNMMRVRLTGALGKFGFVSIAPNDPRALEHSRHVITEAGMAHLISHCLTTWQQERTLNRTKVDIAEYDFNNRRCYRIDVSLTQQVQQAYCWRTVVFLDKQTHLPVRAEFYDWPRQGGPPQGELLEVYSYVNPQFNVNLTDKDFDY